MNIIVIVQCIDFFLIQTHQENTYLEHVAEKVKDRCAQLEQYYEQIVSQTQSEISCILLCCSKERAIRVGMWRKQDFLKL